MIFKVGNTWQSITSQELINLWPSTCKCPQGRHFPDQWSKWKSKKRGTCITEYLPREENQQQSQTNLDDPGTWKLSHIDLVRALAQPCFLHSAGYLPCSKHLAINACREICHIFCCSCCLAAVSVTLTSTILWYVLPDLFVSFWLICPIWLFYDVCFHEPMKLLFLMHIPKLKVDILRKVIVHFVLNYSQYHSNIRSVSRQFIPLPKSVRGPYCNYLWAKCLMHKVHSHKSVEKKT